MTPAADYAGLVERESPGAAMILTPSGKVLHWNAGAEELFGFGGAAAIGRSIFDLIVPADRIEEESGLLKKTLSNGSATLESLRHRMNRLPIYVSISNKVIHDPATRAALILSEWKDVTPLHVKRDTQLVESKFRDLLESVPDAIVIVNPPGHIVYASAQAQRLFGYTTAELVGGPIETLLPNRYQAAHVVHRTGYFIQPRTRSMGAGLELYGRRKDGSEFPVEISLSPLQVEETTMAMSAIRDVSGRKRIEQELRDKNLALENAHRAKDQFLASMSHELRTPLNAIIGFTGTLLMRMPGPLNEAQEKQLRTVQTGARHLLSLINDLLDLAKIEADKLDLNREPVDCVAVIREVAESLRPQAEQKGLEFAVTLPAEPVSVQTDRRALTQIVLNLAGNAIKFTDSGVVRLKLIAFKPPDPERVEISIEDTGPGIRPEDQLKLFDAFTRFGVPGQRATTGTGLGLHLSQKLATLLGGRISCESTPGHGSRFTLTIPD